MRIFVLTTSFPLYEGVVAGPFIFDQARFLVQAGVSVTVLAPHHSGAKKSEQLAGIFIHRAQYSWPAKWQRLCYGAGIPTNLRQSWLARGQLPLLLISLLWHTLRLARQSDILHAHWSLAGLVAIVAGKLMNKPVVLMMHGAAVFVLKNNPLLRFVLKNADYVLYNSRFTQNQAHQLVQPANESVLSPGVDVERFSAAGNRWVNVRENAGIPSQLPILFTLGRLVERKGIHVLLNALTQLPEPRPFLIIGGRGPLQAALETQTQKSGLANDVWFAGYIKDEDLPDYYRQADLFILPAITDQQSDTEGLGVVLLEAQACGTPCIASQVGGISDTMLEGATGLLIPANDSAALAAAIQQLLTNHKQRQQMSQQGPQYMKQQFSWEAKTQQLLAIYKQLI